MIRALARRNATGGTAQTWAGSLSCLRRISSESPKGFAGQVWPYSRAVNHTDTVTCDGQITNWSLPLGITKWQKSEIMTYNSFEEKYIQERSKINKQAFRILGIGWDPSPFSPLYTHVQTHTLTHTDLLTYIQNTCMCKHTRHV